MHTKKNGRVFANNTVIPPSPPCRLVKREKEEVVDTPLPPQQSSIFRRGLKADEQGLALLVGRGANHSSFLGSS